MSETYNLSTTIHIYISSQGDHSNVIYLGKVYSRWKTRKLAQNTVACLLCYTGHQTWNLSWFIKIVLCLCNRGPSTASVPEEKKERKTTYGDAELASHALARWCQKCLWEDRGFPGPTQRLSPGTNADWLRNRKSWLKIGCDTVSPGGESETVVGICCASVLGHGEELKAWETEERKAPGARGRSAGWVHAMTG